MNISNARNNPVMQNSTRWFSVFLLLGCSLLFHQRSLRHEFTPAPTRSHISRGTERTRTRGPSKPAVRGIDFSLPLIFHLANNWLLRRAADLRLLFLRRRELKANRRKPSGCSSFSRRWRKFDGAG